jgi:hypothetical protein
MSLLRRYFLVFLLTAIVLLKSDRLFAQVIPEEVSHEKHAELVAARINQVRTELQVLFSDWQKVISSESSFQGYLFSTRSKNPAYLDVRYNDFAQKLYQPIRILDSGAWIMSVGQNPQQDTISIWIDINGADAPGSKGNGETADQKKFVLNEKGQVTQVLSE